MHSGSRRASAMDQVGEYLMLEMVNVRNKVN